MVPRLYLRRHGWITRARVLATPTAANEDATRVARLARGRVPLQQSAARRALPDDLVGCRVPMLSELVRRDADGRAAVLRLLPSHVRAAATA
jgi:hypothetical protein